MSHVRPVARADIPAVAELLARVTPGAPDVERLERRLELVAFAHPWCDRTLPPLLAEDDTGKIQAFLGVVPRPMQLGTRIVRAAVGGPLAIHPECRELVGVQLLRRFLAGAQDLALMDGGRCATRTTWERLGGVGASVYGLSWLRPIRPAAWMLGRARGVAGRLAALARPFARLVDGAIVRSPRSPLRLPSRPAAACDASDAMLVASMDEVAGAGLHARYDDATLGWILARAEEREGAPLVRLVVPADRPGMGGWCVLSARPGAVAQVIQMGARPDAADRILSAALAWAGAAGAVALAGRLDPRFMQDLTDRRAFLHATGTQMLVHARDASLVRHVERGDAYLGRLDGEWWLGL